MMWLLSKKSKSDHLSFTKILSLFSAEVQIPQDSTVQAPYNWVLIGLNFYQFGSHHCALVMPNHLQLHTCDTLSQASVRVISFGKNASSYLHTSTHPFH